MARRLCRGWKPAASKYIGSSVAPITTLRLAVVFAISPKWGSNEIRRDSELQHG